MALFKSQKTQRESQPILLHPPLVEAIFELRWELEGEPQSGRLKDPSYPMLYGRLYEQFKKEFPFTEDLPSVRAHPETAPYVPRHRFRKEKNGYPLVQMGPGILTVNEAVGYSWSGFKQTILRFVQAIQELYSHEVFPLNFIKSEIRYVNALRFDPSRENPLAFLAEKLHTKVQLDPQVFEQNQIEDRPTGVSLNLAYTLQKPISHLTISTNLGQIDQQPAYILQTLIQSFGETVPADADTFSSWLQEGHDVAENCFRSLCKGALMETFCES